MEDYSDFKCPWISKEDIWKRAEEFRETYWSENTLPVDIEAIIEKRLRLNIVPKHDLLPELDIDAFLRIDLTGIVVDHDCYMDERYSNRLRFSYGHEIGHLELHKDLYARLPISTPEDWIEFIDNMPDREYGHFEFQANEFAGRLLVPRESLKHELDQRLKEIEELGLMDYLRIDPDSVLSRISPSLCKPFGVSYLVIERRVEREELWPPEI
jgi:hypothetical protein